MVPSLKSPNLQGFWQSQIGPKVRSFWTSVLHSLLGVERQAWLLPQAVTIKSTSPHTKVPGGVSPETARGSHTISHQFPMNYGRNRFPRVVHWMYPLLSPFLMAWGTEPPAVSVTGIKKKFEKITKNEIRVWNLSPVFSLTLRVHSHEYQMVLRI